MALTEIHHKKILFHNDFIMTNIIVQIIFFALQKLIAIIIVFHISYQSAIMSEMT